MQHITWVMLARKNSKNSHGNVVCKKGDHEWQMDTKCSPLRLSHDAIMSPTCMRLACIALSIQCCAKSCMRADAGPRPGLSGPALPSPKCLWRHTKPPSEYLPLYKWFLFIIRSVLIQVKLVQLVFVITSVQMQVHLLCHGVAQVLWDPIWESMVEACMLDMTQLLHQRMLLGGPHDGK